MLSGLAAFAILGAQRTVKPPGIFTDVQNSNRKVQQAADNGGEADKGLLGLGFMGL